MTKSPTTPAKPHHACIAAVDARQSTPTLEPDPPLDSYCGPVDLSFYSRSCLCSIKHLRIHVQKRKDTAQPAEADMSSGFVSGGTADAPVERSDEWLAAQEELEATRRSKAEELRQSNGRSLYETLEANKVAKQEAFEEANRLKNQFRALDEDEVEFLDSVLESTRREEERVRRETAEGLLTFRQRQEEADKKLLQSRHGDAGSPVDEAEEEWTAAAGPRKRKRKRKVEREGLKGVKIRRSSTATSENAVESMEASRPGAVESAAPQKVATGSPGAAKQVGAVSKHDQTLAVKSSVSHSQANPSAPLVKASLGLVDYGSDSDEP